MGKKYLDTKKGSLEQSILDLWQEAAKKSEAVSPAQQAAIAISKKEKGEKPKLDEKKGLSGKEVAKRMKSMGKPIDAFASKVAKMKMVTRNDLEKMLPDYVAGSDITKVMEATEKDEGNAFGYALAAAKEKGEKTFVVAGKKYSVKAEEDKLDPVNPKAVKKKFADRKDQDIDNDGDVDDSDKFLHKRRKAISKSVRETWEDAYRQVQERAKIKEDEHEMDDEKPMKKGKTATGKKPDEIDMNPDMEDEGYHKKKK